MKYIIKQISLLIFPAALLYGCQDFLDEKADQKLSVPSSFEDFHALMNELQLINISPADGEVAAGDLYLTTENFDAVSCQAEWDLYLWQDGPMDQLCYGADGWRISYRAIYNYNTVIEGLERYEGSRTSTYYSLLGEAHFFRGLTFLELAVIWCEAYNSRSSEHQLGLPLRLSTDFNEKSQRSNLKETYSRIISDLKIAAQNLPVSSESKMRPNKSAAHGALARAFLFMEDYANARNYADSCLEGKELIDYCDLDASADFPFDRLDNPEIIFERYLFSYMSLYPGFYANVDPTLYELYEENDKRKEVYFSIDNEGLYMFKGSYGGNLFFNYSGIAVDEVYLTLAESCLELGDTNRAKELLEGFIEKRYRDADLSPVLEDELRQRILTERRKQLLFRGIRFADIKRLNKRGENISLRRVIRGEEYFLPANDPRFAILLPLDVIQLSGMEQNRR